MGCLNQIYYSSKKKVQKKKTLINSSKTRNTKCVLSNRIPQLQRNNTWELQQCEKRFYLKYRYAISLRFPEENQKVKKDI